MFEGQEVNWKQVILVVFILTLGFALVAAYLSGLKHINHTPSDNEILANLSGQYGSLGVMHIRGDSMYPAYVDGQKVYVAFDYYENATPVSGDVATIAFHTIPSEYVKRVAFVQGDVLARSGNNIYLDIATGSLGGKRIALDPQSALHKQLLAYNYIIPNGTVILLGDNQLYSEDSRNFGLVSISQLTGKIVK